MPGRHRQPTVDVSATHERQVRSRNVSRVYELKIRGVASDVVRAEFDDVELWEVPGATWLRTGEADTAALYGLIRRIETLGLVLLKVDAGRRRRIRRPAPAVAARPGSGGSAAGCARWRESLAWTRSQTGFSRSAIPCR